MSKYCDLLLRDPDKCRQMGYEGCRKMSVRFSGEAMANGIAQGYEEALSGKGLV